MFFASLKHSQSISDAYASIKSSSPSSASVVSFDYCCILDLFLRRSLEKRPRICMLDSHSVLLNILSVYNASSSHILCDLVWVLFSVSSDIKYPRQAWRFSKNGQLHPRYEEPVPWKAVKHLSLFSHSSVVKTLQGKSRRWFTKFLKYDPPSIDQRTLFEFVSM